MQAVAECLVGLIYVQCAEARRAAAIFGTWPFVSDLRDRRDVGRLAPEQALLVGRLRADVPLL